MRSLRRSRGTSSWGAPASDNNLDSSASSTPNTDSVVVSIVRGPSDAQHELVKEAGSPLMYCRVRATCAPGRHLVEARAGHTVYGTGLSYRRGTSPRLYGAACSPRSVGAGQGHCATEENRVPVGIETSSKQVSFSLTEQPKKQPYAWFPRVQKLCERAIVGAVRLHKR